MTDEADDSMSRRDFLHSMIGFGVITAAVALAWGSTEENNRIKGTILKSDLIERITDALKTIPVSEDGLLIAYKIRITAEVDRIIDKPLPAMDFDIDDTMFYGDENQTEIIRQAIDEAINTLDAHSRIPEGVTLHIEITDMSKNTSVTEHSDHLADSAVGRYLRGRDHQAIAQR